MNKNDLKTLVKECLLEILVEGVGNPRGVNESRMPTQKKQVAPQRKPADLINYSPKQNQTVKAPIPQRVQRVESFRELANGNDVMASIFADTASSGLVESLHESGGASANPVVDTGVDPSLFEGSGNWAQLAFTEPLNRNRQ